MEEVELAVEEVEQAVGGVELVGEVAELVGEEVELAGGVVGPVAEQGVGEFELVAEDWAVVVLRGVEETAKDVKLVGESAEAVESSVAEQPATVAKSGEEAQAEGKGLVEAQVVEAEVSQTTVTASERAVVLMLVEVYRPLQGQKSGTPETEWLELRKVREYDLHPTLEFREMTTWAC